MDTIHVTLTLYRFVLRRAAELALRNWPVLGTVFAYVLVLEVAARVLWSLGLVGGLLLSVVRAACLGSFLYLVEQIVRGSAVTWQDFQRSFGAYLWDVVGVLFLLWVALVVLVPLLLSGPYGVPLLVSLFLLAFVFFNAVPELIYLGHHSPFALLRESYAFILENWIEWFPPNILLAVGLAGLLSIGAPGILGWIRLGAVALFLYFAMVARGLLFQELSGSTRRSRLFRHQARGD